MDDDWWREAKRKARARFEQPRIRGGWGKCGDDEKKFEALEEFTEEITYYDGTEALKVSKNISGEVLEDPKLSEQQMEDMFKRTSYFSLKDASSPSIVPHENESSEIGSPTSDEELTDASSEGEWDYAKSFRSNRKLRRGQKGSKQSSFISFDLRSSDGATITIKKHRKMDDPTKPRCIKIPESIPKSWAHEIQPFVKEKNILEQKLCLDEQELRYGYMTRNISQWDFKDLPKNNHIAVIMNPPWRIGNSDKGLTVEEFAKIKFPHRKMKAGFIFIWVEKELIPKIFSVMESWGFGYVENLVWVKKLANNQVSSEASPFFRRSKASLFVFRKDSPVHIELRHQRNSDVSFQFLQFEEGKELKPQSVVYNIVETLLPEATNTNVCQFLELWARRGHLRKGWIKVVEPLPE